MKFIIITSVLVFSACSGDNKRELAFKEALSSSNNIIQGLTNDAYYSLQRKKDEPETSERALIWFPKADAVLGL